MKISNLIFCFCILTLLSCNKEEMILDKCIMETLERSEMELYEDQEIGCRMTLLLYKYKGEHYFTFDNYCMDLQVIYPIDCDGNELCNDLEENESVYSCTGEFFEKAELIKTIGISL